MAMLNFLPWVNQRTEWMPLRKGKIILSKILDSKLTLFENILSQAKERHYGNQPASKSSSWDFK